MIFPNQKKRAEDSVKKMENPDLTDRDLQLKRQMFFRDEGIMNLIQFPQKARV